jgi:hypothetical protein
VLSRVQRDAPLAVPGLAELPVKIDWFAHRKRVRLAPSEFGALVASRIHEGGPVGLMFHHAAMDEGERDEAGALLALLARHPLASPVSMLGIGRPQDASGRGNPSRDREAVFDRR